MHSLCEISHIKLAFLHHHLAKAHEEMRQSSWLEVHKMPSREKTYVRIMKQRNTYFEFSDSLASKTGPFQETFEANLSFERARCKEIGSRVCVCVQTVYGVIQEASYTNTWYILFHWSLLVMTSSSGRPLSLCCAVPSLSALSPSLGGPTPTATALNSTLQLTKSPLLLVL